VTLPISWEKINWFLNFHSVYTELFSFSLSVSCPINLKLLYAFFRNIEQNAKIIIRLQGSDAFCLLGENEVIFKFSFNLYKASFSFSLSVSCPIFLKLHYTLFTNIEGNAQRIIRLQGGDSSSMLVCLHPENGVLFIYLISHLATPLYSVQIFL